MADQEWKRAATNMVLQQKVSWIKDCCPELVKRLFHICDIMWKAIMLWMVDHGLATPQGLAGSWSLRTVLLARHWSAGGK